MGPVFSNILCSGGFCTKTHRYSSSVYNYSDNSYVYSTNGSCPWERLPDDLIKRVIEKLPLCALIRFRCVCRKWNSWILSTRISPAVLQSSKHMLLHCDVLSTAASPYPAVYNSTLGSWEKLADKLHLSFLPEKLSSLWLVASDGGLLCFETNAFGHFIICNPITKQWKRLLLPCYDQKRSLFKSPRGSPTVAPLPYRVGFGQFKGEIAVSLVVTSDVKRRGYKIVVAGIYEGSKRTTLVYDSILGHWTEVGQVPHGRQFLSQPTSWRGNLYYLVGPGKDPNSGGGPCKLLKYDCEMGVWSKILIPRDLGMPHQVVKKDRSLLVLTNVNGMWKFLEVECGSHESSSAEKSMWLSPRKMPSDLMDWLNDSKGFRFDLEMLCMGHGDTMYFCDARGTLEGPRKKLGKIYHFSRNYCTWLPTPQGDSDDTWVVWRVFTPSLQPVV